MKVAGEALLTPSSVTVPATLPVSITEPTEALQLVLTILLAVRVTAGFTVNVKEETASEQASSNPVAVKVIVISPVVVGVKVGFNAFALLKVPPVLDHVT